MDQVTLTVTHAVLDHCQNGRQNQAQIAVRDPTEALGVAIGEVTGDSRITIKLGNSVKLVVGDRGAIWRAHNVERQNQFDALFDLLAITPGQGMRFLCEKIG